MKKLLVSLVLVLALVAVMAMPAMAVEQSKGAGVTVAEYISVTIADTNADGIKFGSLVPGTDDNPEITQGAAGAVTVTVAVETNTNLNIETKGAGDFTGPGTDIPIGNAKWNNSNAVGTATVMTISYALVDTSTALIAKTIEIYHWLSIPSLQATGEYNTTFWYRAQP